MSEGREGSNPLAGPCRLDLRILLIAHALYT